MINLNSSLYLKKASVRIFFILIIIIHVTSAKSQNSTLHFQKLRVEDGLSQSTVNCILQDRKGFLWFGTQDGLNCYDGYDFIVYKHNASDSTSLSDNFIRCLLEDNSGNIWVGTESGGLNMLDTKSRKFYRCKIEIGDSANTSASSIWTLYKDQKNCIWVGTKNNGLFKTTRGNAFSSAEFERVNLDNNLQSDNENTVYSICQDADKNLWIGTLNGLYYLDNDTYSTTHYKNKPGNPESLSNNQVWDILIDSYNTVWIATENGLNKYNKESDGFKRYFYSKSNPVAFWTLLEDEPGQLWLGSNRNGLYKYDVKNNTNTVYQNRTNQKQSISANAIPAIYKDKSGVLWFSTWGYGLCKLTPLSKIFRHYEHNDKNSNSLSNNQVWTIIEDSENTIWLASDDGLNRFNPLSKEFTCYKNNPNNKYSIGSNYTWSICEDGNGLLWVGTYGEGLYAFNRNTNRFYSCRSNPDNPESLSSDYVSCLLTDTDNTIWIGTYNSGGLNRYDKQTGQFTRYSNDVNDSTTISHNDIQSIYQDRKGTIWIGTDGGGLNKYNKIHNNFVRYQKSPENINSNSVLSLYNDTKGNLWIGTIGGGLNCLNLQTETFSYYTESKGLPNNTVYGILEDNSGNLWLSTNNGIALFDTRSKTFKKFDISDGLQGNEFNSQSFTKGNDGTMYFGGGNGFNTFHPDSIKSIDYCPKVLFTSFRKMNEEVALPKHISELESIELSYKDYLFSFAFAVPEYSAPTKNKYAYKLEGLHDQWIYTDANNRTASFSGLPPGKYVFKVIASNSQGVWNNKPAQIDVFIKPPYWQTWWFKLLGAILALSLFSGLFIIRIKLLKRDKRVQEEFSKNLIQSREQERKRIAAELHDSLGQNLLIANNSVQQHIILNKNNSEYLEAASDSLQEAINETRSISYNLHPHQLDKLGLTKAIESTIKKVDSVSNIQFHTSIDNIDNMLKKAHEIHIYRIVQESLNNILKHAQANKVKVSIAKKNFNTIFLEITDNGIGFDTQQIGVGGIGLTEMKERMKILNGFLQYKSEKNIGTQIIVNITTQIVKQ